jgi:hypothetical protein
VLVRTADARYQAIWLRARLMASKGWKVFFEAGLTRPCRLYTRLCKAALEAVIKAYEDIRLRRLSIASALLHGSEEDRHNEISRSCE